MNVQHSSYTSNNFTESKILKIAEQDLKPVYDRINHEKTTIEHEVNVLVRPLRRQISKYAKTDLSQPIQSEH